MSKWNAGVKSRRFLAQRGPLDTSKPSPNKENGMGHVYFRQSTKKKKKNVWHHFFSFKSCFSELLDYNVQYKISFVLNIYLSSRVITEVLISCVQFNAIIVLFHKLPLQLSGKKTRALKCTSN